MKNMILLMLAFFAVFACSNAFAQEKQGQPAEQPAKDAAAADEKEKQKPRVEKIEGDCEYKASGDAGWVSAEEGQAVEQGGALCTGFDSKVIVRFPGGSTMEVGSLTEVEISTFFTARKELEARLKVSVGSIRVKVQRGEIQSDFQVSTPHTTTSVKGTDWEVLTSFYGDVVKVYENVINARNNLDRKAKVAQGEKTNDKLSSTAEMERESTVTPTVPLGSTEEEVQASTANPANQDKSPSELTSSTNPDKARQNDSDY